MIKRFTPFLVFLALCSAVNAQLIPEFLYYKFDGSGTSVPNLASSPPAGTTTATLMGGLTQGGSQICQGTVIGTGVASSTDYVNTGWAPNLGTSSWTISFRTSNIGPSATLYYIFGDINTASFRCFTNGVAGANNWIIRGAGLTDTYINGGAVVAPTMSTFVYDQPLNQVRGYLNGVLVTTVAQGAPNLTGTGPLKVVGYSTNVGMPANGYLDEFRVYNRALTQAEITQLYNPFATPGFLGGDPAFCAGDSVEIDLGGWPYSSVSWSTGETSGSIWVDSTQEISVTTSGICGAGMDTVFVTEAQAPEIVPSGDPAFCSGDSIMLDVGSGYISYTWSTADTTQAITVYSGGSYDVITVDTSGCSGYDTLTVVENPNPVVNLGPDSTICGSGSLNLDAGAGYSWYAWSTSDSTQSIVVNTSGTYYVDVADSNGCMGSDTLVLSVNPAPTVDLGADTAFCEGGSVMLDAGAGFADYAWSGGQTTQTITVSAGGTHSVTVTDGNGCTGSDDITVSENPLPVAGFTDSPSGLTVTFTNTSTNGTSYDWTFGDGGTSTSTSPSHTYTSGGTFTVTLIATNACGSDTTTSTVTVTGIEDGVFTGGVSLYPNPAQNEVTLSTDIQGAHEVTISVMNAVGQVIYSENAGSISGSFSRNISLGNYSAGVYFVKLSADDREITTRLVVKK
jgi:PKD repeat protein